MIRVKSVILSLMLVLTMLAGFSEKTSAHSSGYECWSGQLYYVTYQQIPISGGNHHHKVTSARNLYTYC